MMPLKSKMPRFKGYFNQILMTILINIPTVSFGLAMGWVSGASAGRGSKDGVDGTLVYAAAGTFLAALVGMPLCARVLQIGRKPTIIATSLAFAVCWSLKIVSTGGWWLVGARCAAGLGSAGAWTAAPLYIKEVASENMRGPLAATIILAQNLGYLLMYIAHDTLDQKTILWVCLALSVLHCAVFALLPESPAFLAANNNAKKARDVLSWLRGVPSSSTTLDEELQNSSPSILMDESSGHFYTIKLILRSPVRRKAIIISSIAVLGQEICGVFALLHYAEQVFALASPPAQVLTNRTDFVNFTTSPSTLKTSTVLSTVPTIIATTMSPLNSTDAFNPLLTPSRQAILLGIVQFVASIVALYLVERMGRKPLLVSSALAASAGMGAAAMWSAGLTRGGSWVPAAALCVAIAADSAGLQPVPYVLMTEMFHYQYRACVVTWIIACSCIANALELAVFPIITDFFGLHAALGAASLATLAYAIFAIMAVPETRDKTTDEIYESISKKEKGSVIDSENSVKSDLQTLSEHNSNIFKTTTVNISDVSKKCNGYGNKGFETVCSSL